MGRVVVMRDSSERKSIRIAPGSNGHMAIVVVHSSAG